MVEHTGFRTGPVYYSLKAEGKGVGFLAAPVEEGLAVEETLGIVEAEAVAIPELTVGGTGPDDTLAPSDGWMSIGAGQWLWFAAHYDGEGSSILVSMDADSDDANFGIWTAETIRRWAAGEKEQPIGRGSDDDFAPGDLSWSGSFPGPASFYIVVQNDGAGVVNFNVTASGKDVWY